MDLRIGAVPVPVRETVCGLESQVSTTVSVRLSLPLNAWCERDRNRASRARRQCRRTHRAIICLAEICQSRADAADRDRRSLSILQRDLLNRTAGSLRLIAK